MDLSVVCSKLSRTDEPIQSAIDRFVAGRQLSRRLGRWTFNAGHRLRGMEIRWLLLVWILRYEDMDIEIKRRRVDAEAERQHHELTRQAAERARVAAEASRKSAEEERRAVVEEVSATIATLTTLLNRMEAVEGLRRELRKDG